MSVNSSFGWLGIAAFPLSTFYFIHVQQKLETAILKTLCSQSSYLRSLKYLGTAKSFPPFPDSGDHSISFAVFYDTGRVESHCQLSYLAGILIELLS